MKNRCFRFVFIIFVLTGLEISVQAETYVGYILEIRGNWHLNRNVAKRLRRGQKLPASGVISINQPNRFDYITIADMNGDVRISRNCNKDCSAEIILPQAPPAASFWSSLYQSVMDWIWGAPDRYSPHRNRSGEIAEGVVKLSGEKIDLSSLVKLKGNYFLRWRAVPPKNKQPGQWSTPVNLKLENDKPVIISKSNLKTGLYEFQLLRPAGDSFEPTAEAWILVSSPGDYEKFETLFNQAVKFTDSWENDVKSETKRVFLQAYLDQLTEQSLKK